MLLVERVALYRVGSRVEIVAKLSRNYLHTLVQCGDVWNGIVWRFVTSRTNWKTVSNAGGDGWVR